MGRRCCIAGCQSTSRLPEHHGVTYHSFPLDAAIRAVWIKNTRLSPERHITKSVLVCSRHFRRNDFQPIRNGKYLLKARVFPTVFPWGKLDQAQVEADQEALKNATVDVYSSTAVSTNSTDDVTKATVAATVAQILAETAELNAAASVGSKATTATAVKATSSVKAAVTPATVTPSKTETSSLKPSTPDLDNTPTAGGKYEPATYFGVGARFQAKRSDGLWYVARVLEVSDNGEEVLVRYERNSKNKMTYDLKPEWINKSDCRQRVNPRGLPVFTLEERCLARWSGPHKFPGTVKKLLENDTYEVLFDDGYTKNVRALHMKKLPAETLESAYSSVAGVESNPVTNISTAITMEFNADMQGADVSTDASTLSTTALGSEAATPANKANKTSNSAASSNKKRSTIAQRKDWPLLDMSKLDTSELNLPEIPRDGEWTCHWVNDQPIGTEGFLIVGEHRKPTVIVEDWRLPEGWVKHMYQRSNVLGKWDVILVSPAGKRFRSKSDLKVFLEDQGLAYNPDIYDFSIHRRRAKDINAYVYTHDYKPQVPPKPKGLDASELDTTLDEPSSLPLSVTSTPLPASSGGEYLEAPVAPLVPPMELMSPQAAVKSDASEANLAGSPSVSTGAMKLEDGYANIGGLKVQMIDNLFRCPHDGCSKNFRKEDHVLIHVKHYHKDMAKLISDCPKMQELAVKRTHPTSVEHETHHRNQIPNQQFFAKLHQQDLQQSRSFRRGGGGGSSGTATTPASAGISAPSTPTTPATPVAPGAAATPLAVASPVATAKESTDELSVANASLDISKTTTNATAAEITVSSPTVAGSLTSPAVADTLSVASPGSKRARFSPTKRTIGSRKSNRQRTTRRYLTAAQATAAPSALPLPHLPGAPGDVSIANSDFEESSRQSYNNTPDARPSEPKRRRVAASATPVSSAYSPATADSISTPTSNEVELESVGSVPQAPAAQYIKENGELIKIVRMRQEEIINCICGYGEEDGLMIQCELCLCWQHGACNGIVKESDVPDKYVCYICRNPQRVRDSMRYKHDQDWLYEGKLPVANYHSNSPNSAKLFEFLKKSHTVTGNLIEMKRFMHSLRVKINIVNNRLHPKLYLWAKKWDEVEEVQDVKLSSPSKRTKNSGAASTPGSEQPPMPHIPQPEAAIDPEECQVRLIEHVKVQQDLVMQRLADIETEVDALEKTDDFTDLKDDDISQTKEALAVYIKELETVKQIAKINAIVNTKESLNESQNTSVLT